VKDSLKKELPVLGCLIENTARCFKWVLIFLGVYALAILLTFLILAETQSFIASAIFSFLLMLEIGILFTAVGCVILLGLLYYGAYFVRKGWNRAASD